jgi:hypothetical protein
MLQGELHDIEPFYGWLGLYNHEIDQRSPFHEVEHNQFYFDRSINHIPAHPLWDEIGSESLLVKILFVDYQEGYAIIELFGEWNDLYDNDFKLLAENVLSYLADYGIKRFILIAENVFHAYLESEDYYQAMQEELGEGWICVLRARKEVKEDMAEYGIDQYFYFNALVDEIHWRKLKPYQLYFLICERMQMVIE